MHMQEESLPGLRIVKQELKHNSFANALTLEESRPGPSIGQGNGLHSTHGDNKPMDDNRPAQQEDVSVSLRRTPNVVLNNHHKRPHHALRTSSIRPSSDLATRASPLCKSCAMTSRRQDRGRWILIGLSPRSGSSRPRQAQKKAEAARRPETRV